MDEKLLKDLLLDQEVLKLERWGESWIATYIIKNHTFHTKDQSLGELLRDLTAWRNMKR